MSVPNERMILRLDNYAIGVHIVVVGQLGAPETGYWKASLTIGLMLAIAASIVRLPYLPPHRPSGVDAWEYKGALGLLFALVLLSWAKSRILFEPATLVTVSMYLVAFTCYIVQKVRAGSLTDEGGGAHMKVSWVDTILYEIFHTLQVAATIAALRINGAF
jgi:hypothetical protein